MIVVSRRIGSDGFCFSDSMRRSRIFCVIIQKLMMFYRTQTHNVSTSVLIVTYFVGVVKNIANIFFRVRQNIYDNRQFVKITNVNDDWSDAAVATIFGKKFFIWPDRDSEKIICEMCVWFGRIKWVEYKLTCVFVSNHYSSKFWQNFKSF